MTQEEMIKQELENNCKKHGKELLGLLQAYDLAVLANDMQEERINECYKEVLKEHEFYASKGMNMEHIKKGDRITSNENAFLMSESDFKLYNEVYSTEKMHKAGITDEKGYYIVNTFALMCDAKRELVDFIAQNIVPQGIRTDIWRNRGRLTIQEKLIKITKDAFGIAA